MEGFIFRILQYFFSLKRTIKGPEKTSVKRPITATLFCPGGQFTHLLLFKPVHNGHLSTTATATNACPQLPK